MAIKDLFNRDVSTLGGVFTSDRGKLSFGGGVEAALVQNLTFTYSQNITRFYEVGGKRIYYVGGRTSGNATIARIIGPSPVLVAFYNNFGDVCQAASNTMIINLEETDCSKPLGDPSRGAQVTYTLALVVLVAISAAIGAQDMIINENSQLMFGSLQYN